MSGRWPVGVVFAHDGSEVTWIARCMTPTDDPFRLSSNPKSFTLRMVVLGKTNRSWRMDFLED